MHNGHNAACFSCAPPRPMITASTPWPPPRWSLPFSSLARAGAAKAAFGGLRPGVTFPRQSRRYSQRGRREHLRRVPDRRGGEQERASREQRDWGQRGSKACSLVKKNSATRVPGAVCTMSYGRRRPGVSAENVNNTHRARRPLARPCEHASRRRAHGV